MKKKLWQNTNNLNLLIEKYTSSDDILLDQNLVSYDIYGSLAHAMMLEKQGLISPSNLQNIKEGLLDILKQFKDDKYTLEFGDEDVHTRIENDLSKKYPEAGAKLHTGRSRNDQVLVDIRLYTKDKLIITSLSLLELVEKFYQQAKKLSLVPLPGMTHMQPAMLSSFGLWLGSFAESLLDDLSLIESVYTLNDQSPLGSGAAYGVTLPIDRQYTTKLLGFNKVQNNALYCQNSKGKIESTILHVLSQVMATLNKFATDSLLFTTEPFSFITFDKSLGTGSSIMPQKQNWDALELMRANYHQLTSAQLQLSTTLGNLPSGYNRDSQQTKGNLIKSLKTVYSSLEIASLFVDSLEINESQVKKHIPKELFAAHWAYLLVQERDMPFRKAYIYVKNHLSQIPNFKVLDLLKEARSQGSTGNLQLASIQKTIQQKKQYWTDKKENFKKIIKKLIVQK